MDSVETEDTGVFSPVISKRDSPHDQDLHDKQTTESETEGTDVFSPDVSLRSRFVRSLNSQRSKENTPPQTQTPSLTPQLEVVDKKGAKRKHHFSVALNTPNSDDESFNDKMDDIFDDLENEGITEKRAKRFQLSPGVSMNDSKSDDTGVFSMGTTRSISQVENKTKRKSRFVVSSNTSESEDSSCYSDVLKSASQGDNKIKRKSRFVPPPSLQDSEDSLLLSDVFKSSSKGEKRKHHFAVPKSPSRSQDSVRYSDVFKSISHSEKKMKRKPRFIQPSCSQESETSLQYSDILETVSKDKNKPKRKHGFVAPCSSQESEDSLHYSEIFKSVPKKVDKIKRKNRFASACPQESEDSLRYSDISLTQNETNVGKKHAFVDPSSQEIGDSLHYSDIPITKDEPNVKKRHPFIDPSSQEIGDSLHYSDITITNDDSNVEKRNPFIDPTSQEIADSLHYSDIRITKDDDVSSAQNGVNNIAFNVSPDSKCIQNRTSECSVSIANSHDEDQHKCEKTSSTAITSVRSIYIDTIRGSINLSTPRSISETTSKPLNMTYDVSTSAFRQREDVLSLTNVNLANVGAVKDGSFHLENIGSPNNLPVITALNTSNERTLVSSTTLGVDESATLIESKNESSNTEESIPVTDESVNESVDEQESMPITDKSENESTNMQESSSMADESENENTCEKESSSVADESENESANAEESIPVTDKSENENTIIREPTSSIEDVSHSVENSKNERDEITESNITPAMSIQSIMIDTIPNSSNTAQSDTKIVEESVYVAFNPSSLMLSVTELVETPSNDQACDVSVDKNKSNQLEELPLPDDAQSDDLPAVIPSSALPLAEENVKEHDYAMVHVSNTGEIVEQPVTDLVNVPSIKEIAKEPVSTEIPTPSTEEIPKEPAKGLINIPCVEITPEKHSSKEITLVPSAEEIPNESASAQAATPSTDDIFKEPAKAPNNIPCPEAAPQEPDNKSPLISTVELPPNDVEISKKTPSPNVSTQSANRSLRKRKSRSRSNVEKELNLSAAVNNSPSSVPVEEPHKSPAPISPANVEQSIASNDALRKSNYSLRSRNSRSPGVQKSPEPVPSTSAAALKHIPIDDSGDGLFNNSNSVSEIASPNSVEISSQAANYFSRSRNSISSNTQTSASKSSVSVFSISKIGRRSSAPKEFKVPAIPKIVLKKKKKTNDPSFKHLPSRPNFPKFDFYCNKRFYDYLTSKMEPKYRIRTNNEAVKLAKYISEVVKEVIAMKSGDHHILIEEMKKVLFQKGIVETHYNFYIFCFDYMPPWFRRKAIPMMRPVNCPNNVEFDLSLLFDSIE